MTTTDGVPLMNMLRILADRPECEHGLNGPCRECGPSLTLQGAITWRQEMRVMHVTTE